MKRGQEGAAGWLGLVAYVIAWDLWTIRTGRETLSGAYGRGLASRRWMLLAAVWVLLTLHLNGRFVPAPIRRLDPIAAAARRVEPRP